MIAIVFDSLLIYYLYSCKGNYIQLIDKCTVLIILFIIHYFKFLSPILQLYPFIIKTIFISILNLLLFFSVLLYQYFIRMFNNRCLYVIPILFL